LNVGVRRALDADTLVGQPSAFVQAAILADAEDRAPAAFLVTAVLETQHRPELRQSADGALKANREFISWAVDAAIAHRELHTDTETAPLVEMLVVMVWDGLVCRLRREPETPSCDHRSVRSAAGR
jgi:hypothetical protein